jgi:hypothetical protein
MKKFFLFSTAILALLLPFACNDDNNEDVVDVDPPIEEPILPDSIFSIAISPQNNKTDYTVGESANITIDVQGTAKEVKFYFDGAVEGTKTAAPYTFSIAASKLTRGGHQLKAEVNFVVDTTLVSELAIAVLGSNEGPNEVGFSDGKLPSTWSTSGWSATTNDKQNDTYSFTTSTNGATIQTSKATGTANGYLEFYVKGTGIVKFYVNDNVVAKYINLSSTRWVKHSAVLDPGIYNFKWELVTSVTKHTAFGDTTITYNSANASIDGITFKQASAPAVGEYYRGGVVTQLLNNGKRILIAAPEDYPEWLTFSGRYPNGESGPQVPGSFSGTGPANTTAIIRAYASLDPSGGKYAAKVIDGYIYNGYEDWFLPNIDELLSFVDNRDNIGGFNNVDIKYWSSSASGAHVNMYMAERPEANRKYANTSQYQPHNIRPFRHVVIN